MRTPENAILSTLKNGGYIKSFYRRSVRARQGKSVLADGYVLEKGEVSYGQNRKNAAIDKAK